MKHKMTDIIGFIFAYIFMSFVVFACIWGNPFAEEKENAKTYISQADKTLIKMMEADNEK